MKYNLEHSKNHSHFKKDLQLVVRGLRNDVIANVVSKNNIDDKTSILRVVLVGLHVCI